MPEPLRIVLAEDNYLVREGTRRLLEDTGQVLVLAAVNNGTELLDAVGRLAADAVITDIRMPPGHAMEGIAAAHTIRATHPGVGVVVLSQHADEEYAFELLKHGTAGLAYLLKDRVANTDELLRALHEVHEGRSVIDPQVVEALVGRRARLTGSPLTTLTLRELDVLHHMAQGQSNRAIGQALFLSQSALEKHITSIFAKLDLPQEPQLHRRVAAVLTFLRSTSLQPQPPT